MVIERNRAETAPGVWHRTGRLGRQRPLRRAVGSDLEPRRRAGLLHLRLTGASPERHHLRGEAMKSEMIWPIFLASSGGTALPIWPYCSVRLPSKK